jgi:hypothetical protein
VRLQVALGLAAAVLAAGANHPTCSPASRGTELFAFAPSAPLSPVGERRLASASWRGGAYTAATGERVTVYLSESYGPGAADGQRWADFFAALLHGSELGTVQAYVAPLEEVQAFCGQRTLGCYGGGRLVTIGEPAGAVTPAEVAAHEYGHHVASNRANPPWRAGDWGPKRWASHANVCARAAAGTAFPGDEGDHYSLNPGEGFAEVFRVLNETRQGAMSFEWPVVDPSFVPDAAGLEQAAADVHSPWVAPSSTVVRSRFARGGARTWRLRVSTPLDGELRISLRLRPGAGHELALHSEDGRKLLARGLWSASRERTVDYTVCGERSVVVRVVRSGGAGPFEVHVTKP